MLHLASHLDTPERARALYVVSALLGADNERWQLARLRTLFELIEEALAHDELTGIEARNLLGRRRAEALALTTDGRVRELIEEAPRSYVLRSSPVAIARHAALVRPPIPHDEGWATQTASEVATAASTADPPSASISRPTLAAAGCSVATTPDLALASRHARG